MPTLSYCPAPVQADLAIADVLAFLADAPETDPGDYRPGWDRDDFAPAAWEDSYWTGHTLRLEGHGPATAPGHFDPIRRADFQIGQVDGLLERVRRERAEQLEADHRADEQYADAFGDVTDRIHPAESCGYC